MTCCFFGHKDTPYSVAPTLEKVLIELIENESVDSFLLGHQGAFDYMTLGILRRLKEKYPQISYNIVLSYMPGSKTDWELYASEETMYPEGLESVPPRFAISWRNKWMINESDIVVCYITHSWGGAAQFVEASAKKRKRVINLGNLRV